MHQENNYTPSSRFRILACFAAVACLLLSAACSHYRLGTGGTLAFSTLYVAPVENEANLPQGAALFSTQLREAFLRDSRVTLVNDPASADATLTVELVRLDRAMTSARTYDTGLARKFDLTLASRCTLRDNRAGRLLIDKRPVTATRQVFSTPAPAATQSDQLQAEYNTMPLLAGALAENISHAVLDVW
ncbi:LPS assembly lipoprotein LptE [Termitidicoccus mucosus]|uniref:LPS-assembly lipoprotein LptE n=1 Tax=Termitidicoccus mucosus TaxID=1184151 RepID=A0A178ILK6_9BACT|nr:hypothetical protein AW736_06525 [Opitutaceae bacterium TSB47]